MWVLKHFSELSATELYHILQLRNLVFVVEQQCVYKDADNKDQDSWHFFKLVNNSIVAYCRLLPPALSFKEASIGRVVTHPDVRKAGYGKEMMQLAIGHSKSLFGTDHIRIGAQLYLQNFYESLGFQKDSAVYMEDDIPHIEMIIRPRD